MFMKSEFIYHLPFSQKTKYIALSHPREHTNRIKNAVDFLMDFNQPILAPLDGLVWNVKDDSNEGGNDEKYAEWKYQNLITIKHSETEFSQYFHLGHKSALVKIGDKVKKGQPIAKSIGMIGFTTAPHLHMLVFKVLDNETNNFESKEIIFKEKVKVIRKIKEIEEIEKKFNKEFSWTSDNLVVPF